MNKKYGYSYKRVTVILLTFYNQNSYGNCYY